MHPLLIVLFIGCGLTLVALVGSTCCWIGEVRGRRLALADLGWVLGCKIEHLDATKFRVTFERKRRGSESCEITLFADDNLDRLVETRARLWRAPSPLIETVPTADLGGPLPPSTRGDIM